MTREKLTELRILRLYLSHPRTKQRIDSLGIRRTMSDDGSTVEITFPFTSGKNEELSNILFGVDYEILTDQEVTSKIEIGVDGICSSFTGVPVKIRSTDNAVAIANGKSVKISPELQEGATRAIALCPETNRFKRSPDLKNKRIDLYRADVIYPRWIETANEASVSMEKGKEILVNKEKRLKEIHLHVFSKEDGVMHHRQYTASLRYIPQHKRGGIPVPANARRIRLHNLQITHHNPIVPHAEPTTSKA